MPQPLTLQYKGNTEPENKSREMMEDMAKAILEAASTRTRNAVLRAYLWGFYEKPLTVMSVQELGAVRDIGEAAVREILHARRNHQ